MIALQCESNFILVLGIILIIFVFTFTVLSTMYCTRIFNKARRLYYRNIPLPSEKCNLVYSTFTVLVAQANRGVYVLQEAAAATAPKDPSLLRAQVSPSWCHLVGTSPLLN